MMIEIVTLLSEDDDIIGMREVDGIQCQVRKVLSDPAEIINLP